MRRRRREAGYTLVVLAVAVTVLSILLAMALPAWSHLIQHAKEEELIFRGLQYAEGIRLYLINQNGNYPTKLEDLVKTQPRCIRQLWDNPLTGDLSWKLLPVGSGKPVAGQAGKPPGPAPGTFDITADRRRPPQESDQENPTNGGPAKTGAVPFHGVASAQTGKAIMTFMGSSELSEWQFTVELVANLQIQPDRLPGSLSSASFWKPFPPGVQPPQMGGAPPGGTPPGSTPRPPRRR